MNDALLCVDCRHCVKVFGLYMCKQPDVVESSNGFPDSHVFMASKRGFAVGVSARAERYWGSLCGREGRLWKPKPPSLRERVKYHVRKWWGKTTKENLW